MNIKINPVDLKGTLQSNLFKHLYSCHDGSPNLLFKTVICLCVKMHFFHTAFPGTVTS